MAVPHPRGVLFQDGTVMAVEDARFSICRFVATGRGLSDELLRIVFRTRSRAPRPPRSSPESQAAVRSRPGPGLSSREAVFLLSPSRRRRPVLSSLVRRSGDSDNLRRVARVAGPRARCCRAPWEPAPSVWSAGTARRGRSSSPATTATGAGRRGLSASSSKPCPRSRRECSCSRTGMPTSSRPPSWRSRSSGGCRA